MSTAFEFGDRVTFSHEYRRYIGKYQKWPAGDRSRYLNEAAWSVPSEPHPESTLSLDQISGTEPVVWRRVLLVSAPLTGIYGGPCSKQEGRISIAWSEDGHGFKRLGTVHLAEVMVRGAGRPLLVVVHPDDLALAAP